ncbi:MAG: hypothetical protein IT338_10960 [Thermomicrobiales bacterium]|nr:hypothetical protein [Thermomicrobiales bacterium]
MGLGGFALISLFYLVIGARVVVQLARNFRATFDRTFTRQDRALVDQAAFFVLVPISVALHELGHAATIRLFGGDVLGWGFYGFAGYVAFDPAQFTESQQIIIAAAGTVVNIVLGALAVGLVFLKRPPFRAAINELLIQFTWISLLNALILYPLLDFATGLNGDWMQMYDFRAPPLNVAILIVHVTVLGIMFWAWKSPRVRARIAELTEGEPEPSPRQRRGAIPANANVAELALREAAARVASGWPSPVEAAIQRGPTGSALVLSWGADPVRRSVIAAAPEAGGIEFSGAIRDGSRVREQRALGRDPAPLDVDRLTMMLRLAMETIDGWSVPLDGASPSTAPTPAAD